MELTRFLDDVNLAAAGADMHRLLRRLYPIHRSITGPGIRETFDVIGEHIPLQRYRVPSGTQVFDWTVPREWTVREAWIKGPDGARVVDVADSTLHLVGYSVPVRETMSLDALGAHLHSLPEAPDLIPFRSSFYKDDWGFCLSHRQLTALPDGDYEVCIDSTLEDGHLDYAECVVEGREPGEVLVSTHACHPALCNDNLSGVVLSTRMAAIAGAARPRWTYRFVFVPTIIGSITWLARNESRVGAIRAGLVVTCVGDPGPFTWKRTRRGDTELDRAVEHVLATNDGEYRIDDFIPYGYDERNYCSPGFDLPVGSLSRTTWGRFPEYHTSADNPDFVTADALAGSLEKYLRVFEVLENNGTWVNQNPKCEPQLGRRGLYNVVGGLGRDQTRQLAMFWVLNLSDGRHSLLDIARRSGIDFTTVSNVAAVLAEHGLLAAGE
jgi:aminopeptidase-like protein